MNINKFNKRVYITGLLMIGIACFFIIKLFMLHFSDKIIIDKSAGNLKVSRGQIKDVNGNILAISIEQYSLFANPEEIIYPQAVASFLSKTLALNKNQLLKRLTRPKRFVWIKRKLSENIANRIKEQKIKGLYFKNEYKRAYPHGSLATNIIGYSGIDNTGLDGIEYRFNHVLNAKMSQPFFEDKDVLKRGNHVVLTIDRFIQYIVEKELSLQMKKLNALQGAVIVTEVNSGRILALANYPRFDANHYYRYSLGVRSNFSVVGSFEPGSTMKIFSALAALRSGKLNLAERYYCSGAVDVHDIKINCTGVHKSLTLADSMRHSCNVGIIKMISKIDNSGLYETLKIFEFGNKINVAMPGESRGILREVKDWSGVSKFSIAIGQEMSVTSLQLAAAYGAIANGGIYYSLSVIDSIEDPAGNKIEEFYPRAKRKIIKQRDVNILKKLLKVVVDDGTGKKAKPDNYSAAGKTGTAQKSKRRGGYYSDKYVISFAGFAPYKRPDICVIVIIDEPQKDQSGGAGATPVFAKIVDKVLAYRGVGGKRIKTRNPKKYSEAELAYDGQNWPDFKNIDLHSAIKTLIEIQKKYSIDYRFWGSGKVVKQYPAAGSKIEDNLSINIYFK
jgi:cell division protein FtsI/penicillin-binding protein 2